MRMEHDQGGFSLIEVMVAMLILAFGIVAGLGMMSASRIGTNSGQETTYAAGLAKERMEALLSIPVDKVFEGPREGEDRIKGFTRLWKLESNATRQHLASVRVRIEWKDGRGHARSYELGTLLSEGIIP